MKMRAHTKALRSTIVERYEPDTVKGASPTLLLAAAISRTLKDSHLTRAEVASLMSDQLGEAVSEGMLNKYASSASEGHQIPAHRLVALVKATADARILREIFSDCGVIVVSAKYEPLIRREEALRRRDQAEREAKAAEAEWKASR